ncbi:Rho family guanine nucleotide exchange factor [Saccharomycopsis crataegensis]|uniref:Rho family guanine nucleotide exchange factor n=1 Tax=Saccharomycopsis crataegensis TaxID=43959 RepID=A0AAV5QSS7_9ASCO|nr:Rho family guanine nucleotide exchange factor [Saccharomycopsis crataegensis]
MSQKKPPTYGDYYAKSFTQEQHQYNGFQSLEDYNQKNSSRNPHPESFNSPSPHNIYYSSPETDTALHDVIDAYGEMSSDKQSPYQHINTNDPSPMIYPQYNHQLPPQNSYNSSPISNPPYPTNSMMMPILTHTIDERVSIDNESIRNEAYASIFGASGPAAVNQYQQPEPSLNHTINHSINRETFQYPDQYYDIPQPYPQQQKIEHLKHPISLKEPRNGNETEYYSANEESMYFPSSGYRYSQDIASTNSEHGHNSMTEQSFTGKVPPYPEQTSPEFQDNTISNYQDASYVSQGQHTLRSSMRKGQMLTHSHSHSSSISSEISQKPLGPRKPPANMSNSPDKTTRISSRLQSLSLNAPMNTEASSFPSPSSETYSPRHQKSVSSIPSPTREKYKRKAPATNGAVPQMNLPTISAPSTPTSTAIEANMSVTTTNKVMNEMAHHPKFIEKQDNKTVLVKDRHKLKKLHYTQSVKVNKSEPNAFIQTTKKSHTWNEPPSAEFEAKNVSVTTKTTATLTVEDKRNSKLPPLPSLDLPSLPFSSSSLTDTHLKQCVDLWSLSKLFSWCKLLKIWFKEALIPKDELVKSLVALIRQRYSKLSNTLIEDNVDTIIEEFEKSGCIYYQTLSPSTKTFSASQLSMNSAASSSSDLLVYFNEDAEINGVLPQLASCYSTKFNHRKANSNKSIMKICSCYSVHCPREPSKRLEVPSHSVKAAHIITQPTGMRPDGTSELGCDWVDHWNLSKEELSEIDEPTLQRQSHLFDLIKGEQRVVTQGRIIVDIYGESFVHQKPPLIPSTDKFYQDAFLTVVPIVETHKKFLLEPLIAKLKTSKFISGVADLYSKWVHEAFLPYLKYVDRMVGVRELIEYEINVRKTSRFSSWISKMDNDPRVTPFGLDHGRLFGPAFLAATMNLPITLKEIQKYTSPTDPEHKRLDKALKSVRKLINKFNTMQDHAVRTRALSNLNNSLLWRSGKEVDLDWESQDRRIVKRGQVSKKRDMWLNSYSHIILLDNYLLISDEIKDSPTSKKYRVTETPISMNFLLVEIDTSKTFAENSGGRVGTNSSEISNNDNSQDPVIYPFKIRDIGHNESWTFYTNSTNDRFEWLNAIQEAQSKYFEQERKKEPLKLRVISDAAFAFDRDDIPHKLPIYPKNSAIDLGLQEVWEQFPGATPRPLMYSKVNSSESFNYNSREYTLIGCGYGVFLSDSSEIRNWKRVLELRNVTQLKVLEEFNLLVVLADRILQYYKLDSIFTVYKGVRNKTIGQRLSKQYVSFFKIGQQKGSTLLFYCKQKVSSSGCFFKVMIPKLDDASNNFEYFEEHRKFNIQAECYNLTIFNNTFSIHTVKGLEILSLSILQSHSIPILTDPNSGNRIESGNVEIIRKKISLASCKPMGLFKINENKELLLVYNDFAIICDNHGILSRYSILQFTFRCTKVAFQDDLLIIAGKNIIEVFKIDSQTCVPGFQNKPVQVIGSKEISLIDDAPGKTKFSMIHPSELGRQLVVELLPNEYYKS